MPTAPIKNLTVRLDPETREQLELIAEREVRPLANQIIVFIRQGIKSYLKENDLAFHPFNVENEDGQQIDEGLILDKRELPGTMELLEAADLPPES